MQQKLRLVIREPVVKPAPIPPVELDDWDVALFAHSYILAALWSSNDESRPDGGDPIDENYSSDDLCISAKNRMYRDCRAFMRANYEDLMLACALYSPREGYAGMELAGHDFWLTRNGHGVGFWDRRELEEGGVGERLTEACKREGEANIYVDDGKIYHY